MNKKIKTLCLVLVLITIIGFIPKIFAAPETHILAKDSSEVNVLTEGTVMDSKYSFSLKNIPGLTEIELWGDYRSKFYMYEPGDPGYDYVFVRVKDQAQSNNFGAWITNCGSYNGKQVDVKCTFSWKPYSVEGTPILPMIGIATSGDKIGFCFEHSAYEVKYEIFEHSDDPSKRGTVPLTVNMSFFFGDVDGCQYFALKDNNQIRDVQCRDDCKIYYKKMNGYHWMYAGPGGDYDTPDLSLRFEMENIHEFNIVYGVYLDFYTIPFQGFLPEGYTSDKLPAEIKSHNKYYDEIYGSVEDGTTVDFFGNGWGYFTGDKYGPYNLTEPIKKVSDKDETLVINNNVEKDEVFTYDIFYNVPIEYTSYYYNNFSVKDVLPKEVKYVSTKVLDEKGTDVTPKFNISHKGQKVLISLKDGADPSFYSNTYDFKISVKLDTKNIKTINGSHSFNNIATVTASSSLINESKKTNKTTTVYETTSININKVWEDGDNQDKIRPDSVEASLFANGKDTSLKTTLSSQNNWEYTFEDIPKKENGKNIVYSIKETPVNKYTPEYTISKDGTKITITNKHTPETISLTVNKFWKDQNNLTGNRPDEIEVILIANGFPTENKKIITKANNWTVIFENIPKKANGVDIDYTIQETPVKILGKDIYYTPNYNKVNATLINITNTITGTRPIIIEKEWNDEGYAKLCRPPYLTLDLMDSFHTVDTFKIKEENKIDENRWQIFYDVPLFDKDGNIINNLSYHVNEYYPGLKDIYSEERFTIFEPFKFTDESGKNVTLKMISKLVLINTIKDTIPEFNGFNNTIYITKLIVNDKNQPATRTDFDRIKINEQDSVFKVSLKELKRVPTNKGMTYKGYTGREFNGLLTLNNVLVFNNIEWGKYEVVEIPSQYFKLFQMQTRHSTDNIHFSVENGKYYITIEDNDLSGKDGRIDISITNKIDPERPYDDTPAPAENLIKNQDEKNIGFKSSYHTGNGVLPFELFEPTVNDNEKKPLIISLHGAGDFSASKNTFESHFLVHLFKNWHTTKLKGFNAYVVCPHGVGLSQWNTPTSAHKLDDLIDYLVRTYNIDENKIIIQGHSAGGQGALYMAATRPDRFSAAIIVSGYPCSANVNNIKCPIKGYSGNPTREDENGHAIPHEDNDSFDYMATIFDGTPFDSSDWYRLDHTHNEMPAATILLDENNNGQSDVIEWALAQ